MQTQPAPVILPPPVPSDPELTTARTKISDIRDHCLTALNYFARGSRPWTTPGPALQPRSDVDVSGRPYYTQFSVYSRQHGLRSEVFTTYFGAADALLGRPPVPVDQRPESVFGSYHETDAAVLARLRNDYVRTRLRALDTAAGAVDRQLGEVGAHFRNQNANLGLGIHSGGWRTDTGSAQYLIADNRAMYIRYNAAQRRFEYAIGDRGLTGAGLNGLTYRAVTANPPVVLRHPALAETHATNRGSAGMTVDFADPRTGHTRPLRLVVALADPTKPITDPANRNALEASIMVDSLREGRSIRQAVFAANAATVRARYGVRLGAEFDAQRTSFVARRSEETRQDNVVRTILINGGTAVYGDPPAAGQPRPLLHYELPGNPDGTSTRTVLLRHRAGSWEYATRPESGGVPPVARWTRLDAPQAVASYAQALPDGDANPEPTRIRRVLGLIRDRQSTPLASLPAVTTTVDNESRQAVVALRLTMRNRLLNPAFGFVPVPTMGPTTKWTLNTGDVQAEVKVVGNGLQYRMRSRTTRAGASVWSAWDPPGNGNWNALPASAVAIPTSSDGTRDSVAVQRAHVHNLLFRIGHSTRLGQDLPTIRRELAAVETLALCQTRMGSSGDPARDLLIRMYGAETVGPSGANPEPYGPGVLRLTVGSGANRRIVLLRRRQGGQADTGFGLWEAATVPQAPATQPTWRLITPGPGANPPWVGQLNLPADHDATRILKLLPRFNYSTQFTYGDPGARPRIAPFNPITQPIRAIEFDPMFPNQRRDESARQGELLIRSLGYEYDRNGIPILAAAQFNPASGGPASIRLNPTSKVWEVRYGAGGSWIACGQPGSFPVNATIGPQRTRANHLIYLLGELNSASAPPPAR